MDDAGFHAGAVVLLQTTSPLRTALHIDEAIDLFDRTGADTVTAVSAAKEHPWWTWTIADGRLQPFFTAEGMMTDRSALPPAYVENGSVYVVRRDVLDRGTLYGSHVVPYVIEGAAAIDIDTAEDFAAAERML